MPLTEPLRQRLDAALMAHNTQRLPLLRRLQSYYRNPLTLHHASKGKWYSLAQEDALPARIKGRVANADAPREPVVENDIGWRIHTMVDFLFGKPISIRSASSDTTLRAQIESALDTIWERSGGNALLHDAALLAHIYGHIDMVLRIDPSLATLAGHPSSLIDALNLIRIELIDPTRAVPILSTRDYRTLDALFVSAPPSVGQASPFVPARLLEMLNHLRLSTTGRKGEAARGGHSNSSANHSLNGELILPGLSLTLHAGRAASSHPSLLPSSQLPVVHIQNTSQPFRYEGISEVEPLIPLQDELNTRLSDRASRVTMQSFKMYLAKGIDGFDRSPISPGVVWSTDNPAASISEFGGDASSPSEESHIAELREALDKVSAVPPIATGVIKAKIGNLTSANALRITLMGALSKTARKRIAYAHAITTLNSLILDTLDAHNILSTPTDQRTTRIDWPDPLPVDPEAALRAAEIKQRLGVPADRLLKELGYAPGNDVVA